MNSVLDSVENLQQHFCYLLLDLATNPVRCSNQNLCTSFSLSLSLSLSMCTTCRVHVNLLSVMNLITWMQFISVDFCKRMLIQTHAESDQFFWKAIFEGVYYGVFIHLLLCPLHKIFLSVLLIYCQFIRLTDIRILELISTLLAYKVWAMLE